MSGLRVEANDTMLPQQVSMVLFAIGHGAAVPVHGTKAALSDFFYKMAEQLANEHNSDNQRIRTFVLRGAVEDRDEIPF